MKYAKQFGLMAIVALLGPTLWADPSLLRNPPSECGDGPGQTPCECDTQSSEPKSEEEDVRSESASSAPGGTEAENECVQVTIPLGRASVMSDSRGISLRIYTSTANPALFTPEKLRVVMGYSFNALGSGRTNRKVPSAVLFNQSRGEPIRFVFKNGESLGIPDPGVHVELNERVQMVDAEGWATAEDPAYYDLYPGDGTVWRFYATDIAGRLGELVSYTDPRGRVITAADFGVDIVRGKNGLLRQVVTPSRLADIVMQDETTYTVRVYPLTAAPAFVEGLYVPPQGLAPVETVTVARGEDDRHLNVTVRKGTGDARLFRYVYVGNDWTLTRPSGLEEIKEMTYGDDENALIGKTVQDAQGKVLSKRKTYLTEAPWGGYMKHWTAEGVWDIEGETDVARTNRWEYVMSGPAKGKVSKASVYTGKVTAYGYDELARVIREAEGDGETEWRVTTTSYAPVVEGDRTSLRDTRPRCVVVTERDPESGEQVEVTRTYWAYLPSQEIVERAATAGAAYGAEGALRTVKTWYAPDDETPYCAGRLKSIRHENGSVEHYTYALEGEIWRKIVTFLHEEAPEPVSGKTTRRNILYNRIGDIIERNQEAFIDGAWHFIDCITYEYDIEGHVIKETDFAGRVTTTVWGGNCCGKSSMELPNGIRFTYTYDDEGRLIAETKLDPQPCTTHYEYDSLGRVVKTWKDGLNPETMAYDVFGQVVSRTDVRGGVTQTAYSRDGTTVTTTLPNGGMQIRKTNMLGRLVLSTNPITQARMFDYSPLKTVKKVGAKVWVTQFNLWGRICTRNEPNSGGHTKSTYYVYDNYGRVSEKRETGAPVTSFVYENGNEDEIRTQCVAEERRVFTLRKDYVLHNGNVFRRETHQTFCEGVPMRETQRLERLTALDETCRFETIEKREDGSEIRQWGTDSLVMKAYKGIQNPEIRRYQFGALVETVSSACVTNQFERDALGRVVKESRNSRESVSYCYDSRNLLTAKNLSGKLPRGYRYDVMGRLIAETVDGVDVRCVAYDLEGQKVREWGNGTRPSHFSYDMDGHLKQWSFDNEKCKTVYVYDEVTGVLLQQTNADGGTISYHYAENGKVASITNARGIVTTFRYDGWGQLTEICYSDETPSVYFTYDSLGQRIKVQDVRGETVLSYDAAGHVVEECTTDAAGQTMCLGRFYDTTGRFTGFSIDNIRYQTIRYDEATGLAIAVTTLMGTSSVSFVPGTLLPQQLRFPNGATERWEYEEGLSRTKTFFSAFLPEDVCRYDADGRLIELENTDRTSPPPVFRYRYNGRGEIIETESETFAYDNAGNRLNANDRRYQTNEQCQYTQIGEFTPHYDVDGNQTVILTETGVWEVDYDANNRAIRWRQGENCVTFTYDAWGRMASRTVLLEEKLQKEEVFMYDGQQMVARYNRTEKKLSAFVRFPLPNGSRLLSMHYHGTFDLDFAYACDVLGNVVGMVAIVPQWQQNEDSAERPICFPMASYYYSVFGRYIGGPFESFDNPFHFASEHADPTLGVVHYTFRDYNPLDGRWCTRDPTAVTENPYCFLGNGLGKDWLGLADCSKVCESDETKFLFVKAMAEMGRFPAGLAVCCDGKAYSCTMVDDFAKYHDVYKKMGLDVDAYRDAEYRGIAKKCLIEHENVHVKDAICDNPCGIHAASLSGKKESDECAAYTQELRCLKSKDNP